MEISKDLFDLLVLKFFDDDNSRDGDIQEKLMDVLRMHGCTNDDSLFSYIQKIRLKYK